MSAADEIRAYTAGVERARAAYYRDPIVDQARHNAAAAERMRKLRAERKDAR